MKTSQPRRDWSEAVAKLEREALERHYWRKSQAERVGAGRPSREEG